MNVLQLLNLYSGYPVADPFHATNPNGFVRFIGPEDALILETLQRYQGDAQHRTILLEGKVNELVALINANPFLQNRDETPYVRTDGTKPFTSPVAGVTPTDGPHLATKAYADSVGSSVLGQLATVSDNLDALTARTPIEFQSPWTEYVWQAGQKTTVNLQVAQYQGQSPDADTVTGITIMERLDIAVPTLSNPTPPVDYRYRELTATNKSFALEDFWLIPGSRTVRVLIPNLITYDAGYAGSGYEALQTPRARWLKAVVRAKGA